LWAAGSVGRMGNSGRCSLSHNATLAEGTGPSKQIIEYRFVASGSQCDSERADPAPETQVNDSTMER